MSCAARRLTTIESDCSSARKKALRRAHGNCATARDTHAGDLKPADFGSNERAVPTCCFNRSLTISLQFFQSRHPPTSPDHRCHVPVKDSLHPLSDEFHPLRWTAELLGCLCDIARDVHDVQNVNSQTVMITDGCIRF
jgi:hypothetical protein